MAEYTCTDKQEVMATIKQSDFSEIRITRLLDKETDEVKSVDIRQWYCTKADSTMKPSKGIRIKDTEMAEVLWGILNAMSLESLIDFESAHKDIHIVDALTE